MRLRWVVLVVVLLVVVVLPLVVAQRVLTTEPGLRWALAQLAKLPTVRIEAQGASGTLAGPFTVERLVVDHEAVRIEARAPSNPPGVRTY